MLKIKLYRFNRKLPEPNTISFHTFYYQENILVYLHWNNLIGIGESAPFKPITGDSTEDVVKQAKRITSLSIDPQRDTVGKLHEILDQYSISSTTLRAGVDFAYHDLVGKLKKIPVYKLYVRSPLITDNSYTIMIKDSPEDTVQDVKSVLRTYPHLRILKIKLKGEQDIERTKAVKGVAPSSMKFIIDANQGYHDEKEAVETLTEIGKVLGNVFLVEEPCPKGDLLKLKYVKDHVKGMMVFADESAATFADAQKIVAGDAAHGINIKLQKAGGIWQGKRIAELCNKNGLRIMVGCMLEGQFGISAGTHFAASTQGVMLTDLDSDLDMPNFTLGEAQFIDGKRLPSGESGIGARFDKKKLQKLQKQGEIVYEEIHL